MVEWYGRALFIRNEAPWVVLIRKKKRKERLEVDRRSLIAIKCADKRGEKGMSTQLKTDILNSKLSFNPLIFT